MNSSVSLNIWEILALNTCPNCQNQGLLIENQFPIFAILVCQKCPSKYWISAIRKYGAYQLFFDEPSEEHG